MTEDIGKKMLEAILRKEKEQTEIKRTEREARVRAWVGPEITRIMSIIEEGKEKSIYLNINPSSQEETDARLQALSVALGINIVGAVDFETVYGDSRATLSISKLKSLLRMKWDVPPSEIK